ncbi:hypothetical protein EON65_44565 [archaeon]|nr:MAG: hypothetical protein EON65_44565 [archaeon]
MPRRTRDLVAEEKYLVDNDQPRCFYRRVGLDESDRGELYPIWTAGIRIFAHFGIGVGIYFSQLLFLAGVSLIGAIIMVIAAQAYRTRNYNANMSEGFMKITAACDTYQNITVSLGCDHGQDTCQAVYSADCDMPYRAGVADLAMSCFFAFAVFASVLFERQITEELDESVQTAQDYSIEVKDPPADADNPDEWQAHFSRFGIVRYVTILRKNQSLLDAVRKYHKYERKVTAIQKTNPTASVLDYYTHKLQQYAKELEDKCRRSYPVCRVYVTFEHEEHQRLCLRDNEVPDMYAMLDIRDKSQTKRYFRSSHVLDVVEPPEPDSIIWGNLEVPMWKRVIRRFISGMVSLGVLVCVWYVVRFTQLVSPGFLAIAIGFIDAMLPSFFESWTNFAVPLSEGWKQSTLQVRLFAARLLLSTVLPYIQTQWNKVLDPAFIRQIVGIQVAACFTATTIAAFDFAGVFSRKVLAPRQHTQEEMNLKHVGSNWSLAEKYTNIAKVLFISLYYSLLIPYSLFLCIPAFALIFFVDRYLLLRKWRQIPMLDGKVAVRLRQQAILAVAAHMYVSMRFIYSWPMDEVFIREDGEFEKVNKFPIFGVWGLNLQSWQSEGQKRIFYSYKICLFLIAATAFIVWIFVPAYHFFRRMFCYNYKEIGQSQGIPFSKLSRVSVYEPCIQTNERNYLCCQSLGVLSKHRPSVLVVAGPADPLDLSEYVPPQHRMFSLSIVKYYGTDTVLPVVSGKENVLHRMIDISRSVSLMPSLQLTVDEDSGRSGEEGKDGWGNDNNRVTRTAMPEDLFNRIRGKPVAKKDRSQQITSPTFVPEGERGSAAIRAQNAQTRVRSLRMHMASKTMRDSKIQPSASPPKRNYRYARQYGEEGEEMELV